MSEFLNYLSLGFSHIIALAGRDHILFIIALCAIYEAADWKKILLLVTAFTLGHSITLALATLDVISYNKDLIEFLIPVTIVFTCVLNVNIDPKQLNGRNNKAILMRYPVAMVFGLIHGMGFSSFLKSMLGKDQSIISQLLAFNIGLEFGQILIVSAILFFSLLCLDILKIKRSSWILVTSGITAGMALEIIFKQLMG